MDSFDNRIQVGSVYRITYFLVLNNQKRKFFKFTGLCTQLKKKSFNFYLINVFNREKVKILFHYYSPHIFQIEKLDNYYYKTSRSKLLKNNNLVYKNSLTNDFFKYTQHFDIFYFLLDLYWLNKRKARLIRRKFRLYR